MRMNTKILGVIALATLAASAIAFNCVLIRPPSAPAADR
jgi:hypothetical protein